MVMIEVYQLPWGDWRADAYRPGEKDWFVASAWASRDVALAKTQHFLTKAGLSPADWLVRQAGPAPAYHVNRKRCG